ncbi:hypothetical protein BpHYR1_051789 [Brachionus plicatilis]|uniref:Alpha 1,4-glycosyltransferase domain-containing protein n=1 Tax=Brachionus plicatilis TaxID=10195 RepID=A0A3M7T639_BRAPC|nr:hypothetical protein BpHYR1_051789 [Brachionus plicatilis]
MAYYDKSEKIYEELVFRVNKEFSANKINDQQDKCDMVILTNDYFFPVHWSQHKSLFEKNSMVNISAFKNAYGIHFYGKFSHYYDLEIIKFTLKHNRKKRKHSFGQQTRSCLNLNFQFTIYRIPLFDNAAPQPRTHHWRKRYTKSRPC